jgi:predicted ester cyclase
MITTNRLIEWRAITAASTAVNLRGERKHLLKKLSVEDGPAFVALMRHYVVDYTNRHDQSEAESIMEPDYVLRMGDHVVLGRDDAYRAATAKQFRQFPGLTLTVHEVVTSGERLAMRFSEHGASRTHGGSPCSWGGIGLYSWNGRRLVSNFVEQDYFSRREQLAAGRANPVESPALAPWDTAAQAPDPIAESITRAWLDSGAVAATPGVLLDDQWISKRAAPLIDQRSIELNDLFSCGVSVAFHATQHGTMRFEDKEAGTPPPAFLHMAGLIHIREGRVASGRVIRNRLDLVRRSRPCR